MNNILMVYSVNRGGKLARNYYPDYEQGLVKGGSMVLITGRPFVPFSYSVDRFVTGN